MTTHTMTELDLLRVVYDYAKDLIGFVRLPLEPEVRERGTVSLFGLVDAIAAYQRFLELTDAPKEDQ